jgi:hypothetical protein
MEYAKIFFLLLIFKCGQNILTKNLRGTLTISIHTILSLSNWQQCRLLLVIQRFKGSSKSSRNAKTMKVFSCTVETALSLFNI